MSFKYVEDVRDRGLPYGSIPYAEIIDKMEETDMETSGNIELEYEKYIRSEICDWSLEAPYLESDHTRRDPSLSKSILNLRHSGTRGELDWPRHPEMFLGFTEPDTRGLDNLPHMEQYNKQISSRMPPMVRTMGKNDDIHISEQPWTNMSISTAHRDIQTQLKNNTKVFTDERDGRALNRNMNISYDSNKKGLIYKDLVPRSLHSENTPQTNYVKTGISSVPLVSHELDTIKDVFSKGGINDKHTVPKHRSSSNNVKFDQTRNEEYYYEPSSSVRLPNYRSNVDKQHNNVNNNLESTNTNTSTNYKFNNISNIDKQHNNVNNNLESTNVNTSTNYNFNNISNVDKQHNNVNNNLESTNTNKSTSYKFNYDISNSQNQQNYGDSVKHDNYNKSKIPDGHTSLTNNRNNNINPTMEINRLNDRKNVYNNDTNGSAHMMVDVSDNSIENRDNNHNNMKFNISGKNIDVYIDSYRFKDNSLSHLSVPISNESRLANQISYIPISRQDETLNKSNNFVFIEPSGKNIKTDIPFNNSYDTMDKKSSAIKGDYKIQNIDNQTEFKFSEENVPGKSSSVQRDYTKPEDNVQISIPNYNDFEVYTSSKSLGNKSIRADHISNENESMSMLN